MNRRLLIGTLFLTNLACQSPQAQTANNSVASKTNSVSNFSINSQNEQSDKNSNEVVETFSDDKNIGVRGKNKIELSMMRKTDDSSDVELKFYSLGENNEWKLKQKVRLESDSNRLDAKLSDFNNDGLNDLTYVSALAARGANEIRTLFIYDKAKNELIHIKNSEDYPNLLYNKELNCLDAQRFYGETVTEFLKIEGDVLKEFAFVKTVGNERTVYSVDKNGKRRLLRKDKVGNDDSFTRYKNFNPPKEYTAADLKQEN